MSIDAISVVWKKSTQKGSALLLMLALADFADECGECWPSIETLAEKIRMTPRNTQIVLRSLEKSGEIKIGTNEGPYKCNLYTILIEDEIFSGRKDYGAKKSRAKGEKSRKRPPHKGMKQGSPDPIDPPIDPSVNNNAGAREGDPGDGEKPKDPTPHQIMFERLCYVLFKHTNTKDGLTDDQRGLLNAESKRLLDKLGATPDDLAGWYKQVWIKLWPGCNGQNPRAGDVRSGIAAWIENDRKPPAIQPANNSRPSKQALREYNNRSGSRSTNQPPAPNRTNDNEENTTPIPDYTDVIRQAARDYAAGRPVNLPGYGGSD